MRLFSLENSRLKGDLVVAFQYLRELIRKMGIDFLAGLVGMGQGVMVLD